MIEGEDMEDGGMDKFKVIILCISQDSPEKLFHFCSATKLCPTLCGPMDCSLPGSSVHRIFWARILEWIAFFYSRGSS